MLLHGRVEPPFACFSRNFILTFRLSLINRDSAKWVLPRMAGPLRKDPWCRSARELLLTWTNELTIFMNWYRIALGTRQPDLQEFLDRARSLRDVRILLRCALVCR